MAGTVEFKRQFACACHCQFSSRQSLFCHRDTADGGLRERIRQLVVEILHAHGVFDCLRCAIENELRAIDCVLVGVVEFLREVGLQLVCFGYEILRGFAQRLVQSKSVFDGFLHKTISCDIEILYRLFFGILSL